MSEQKTSPITIPYEEGDQLVHTDEQPSCSDPTCPCQGQEGPADGGVGTLRLGEIAERHVRGWTLF